ncbi:MAG: F0F1 ATP synthase subunit A [Acidimicrobiales bacterium]
MGEHAAVLAINIPVGDHVTSGAFNVDTIWATGIAAAVVLGLGFLIRAKVTSGVPGRVQLVWETVVGGVADQVESSLGPRYRRVVPLGVTIFVLVLVADWVEILPGLFHNTDYLPSPTADVNLCYALGITVFVLTNAAGIRAKGLGRSVLDFFSPLHVLEHITRPFTLALRLFGNLFAGGIMIALLISFPIYFAPVSVAFTVIWKLFDMFIGVIQAFIFALLTILYYQFSTESH